MRKVKLSIFAIVAGLILSSCAKTNDPTPTPTADARDGIVGVYVLIDSTNMQFSLSKPALPLKDSLVVTNAVLKVSKNSDATKADFAETGGYIPGNYFANGVKAVNNGTVFNIPSQTVKDSSGAVSTWTGVTSWSVGGDKYDGAVISNKLRLSYSGTVSVTISGTTYVIPFIGRKSANK